MHLRLNVFHSKKRFELNTNWRNDRCNEVDQNVSKSLTQQENFHKTASCWNPKSCMLCHFIVDHLFLDPIIIVQQSFCTYCIVHTCLTKRELHLNKKKIKLESSVGIQLGESFNKNLELIEYCFYSFLKIHQRSKIYAQPIASKRFQYVYKLFTPLVSRNCSTNSDNIWVHIIFHCWTCLDLTPFLQFPQNLHVISRYVLSSAMHIHCIFQPATFHDAPSEVQLIVFYLSRPPLIVILCDLTLLSDSSRRNRRRHRGCT